MEAPRIRPGRLLAVLLVAPFLGAADATIANVATPSIHADLGASGAALELVVGGYLIAFAVLVITGARLGQTHGYRRIFLLGCGVFSLASLFCGLAPDPATLVAARVLQGSGAALMFPQTLTGIQLQFAGRERKRAIGLYAVALSAGAVAGQILAGALIAADIAGSQWRAIFLINLPIGACVLAAALRYLPKDEQRSARHLDLAGIAVLSLTMILVVLPLALGRSQGWPAWTWLCLAASAPALLLFLAAERHISAKGGSPLVDVGALARSRGVGWALLTLLAANGTYYALLFTLAQYLQDGLGDSPLVSALMLVPWVAAFGVAGQIVRRLPQQLAARAPVAGCLLLATAYAAISIALFSGSHGKPLLLALLAAGGLGLGIQFSALLVHVTSAVPPDYAPDISGVSTTTLQIGGSLGVAAIGTLYLGLAAGAGGGHATHAFAVTVAVCAGIALLAAVSAGIATANRSYEAPRMRPRASA